MAKKTSTALFLTRNAFDWTRLVRSRSGWKCAASGRDAVSQPDSDAGGAAADIPLSRTGEPVTLCECSSDAIFKLLNLPSTDPAELHDMAALQLAKLMPLPEEEMSFSLEMLSTGENDSSVMACAVPNASLEELAATAGIHRSRVVRIDSSALAFIRNYANAGMCLEDAREALLFEENGELILCVLNGGRPELVHSAGPAGSPPADFIRAVRLSLFQAEREAGPAVFRRITIASGNETAESIRAELTGKFDADVRVMSPADIGPVSSGAATRTAEESPFDLTPAAWRTSAADRKFRKTLFGILAGGLLVWTLAAAALYGGSPILKQRAAILESSIQALEPSMRAVNDVRNRVRMIQAYMDRSMSALETLREISINMPEGVNLTSFRYSRADGRLDIQGTAKSTPLVYQFKQKVDASPMFSESALKGPTTNPKTGDAGFELKVLFTEDEK